MSADRWQRLQALFDALVELPPEQHDRWLQQQPDDDALKREALKLLRADQNSGAAVTRQFGSAVAELASTPASGLMLGPYRLLCEIGSGGMGTVFLAERADAEFDRQVAIKLIRGIPTREAAERLRRERQILAKLEHPHIARLLDGGTSADGQPYLVMEFIDGVPITRWCREHQPTLVHKIELFRKVCLAMQYAHQRLIIHRDLKPANVLVRKDGEPALLDFGIAKLLDPSASSRQDATGAHWFTPTYASPEQRRGEAVSTATDVYALGLLLSELLWERVPGSAHSPPASPQHDSVTRIPRELALIIERATHEEPARRYATPEALSEDLRRYLRGRPILAAPDSWRYRSAKFLRRHPFAFATVAVAVLATALFTRQLAAERDRALRAEADAQRESTTSRHVIDYLVSLFDAASPEHAGTASISPRELIDRGHRDIEQRLANEPQQRARLLAAFARIYYEMGDPDIAAATVRKAAVIEHDLGNLHQEAIYLSEVGYELNLAERPEEAEPVLLEAISKLQSAAPGDVKEMVGALSTLALVQARTGSTSQALITAQQARDLVQRHAISDADTIARSETAQAEAHLRNNQLADAEKAAQRAIDVLRQHYAADAAEVISAIGFMTDVYERQGRHADRERLLREMLTVRLRTLTKDSAWAITARNNLAQAVYLQGRMFEALALFRENLDYLRAKGQQESPSYSITLNNLASLSEQAEDFDTAIALFREAVERNQPQAGKPDSPRLPLFRQNLGRSLLLAGKLDEAWPLLEAPIEESLDSQTDRARRLLHLAEWMRRRDRLDEAYRYLTQAGAAFSAFLPASHPRQGAVARTRALILRDQGKLDEAAAQLQQALEVLRAGVGAQANATLEVSVLLAEVELAQGRREQAAQRLRDIAGPVDQRFVREGPLHRLFERLQRQLATPVN